MGIVEEHALKILLGMTFILAAMQVLLNLKVLLRSRAAEQEGIIKLNIHPPLNFMKISTCY
ncbi:MAG: hypothetical protein QXP47_03130 [Candidatus Nezhaarchaeales archaeon]|nr:MAG: hypothetical protein DSO06_03650 [Candidatus Nezhaarchaeota archaeon WYZ-LMO8]TDA37075.1 MAG: hypothetical protein DSO05_01270 [Candidatus Nezhaarchaeota archaeon WYZ-LMO7]